MHACARTPGLQCCCLPTAPQPASKPPITHTSLLCPQTTPPKSTCCVHLLAANDAHAVCPLARSTPHTTTNPTTQRKKKGRERPPAVFISSRQMMQTWSARCRSSSVALGKLWSMLAAAGGRDDIRGREGLRETWCRKPSQQQLRRHLLCAGHRLCWSSMLAAAGAPSKGGKGTKPHTSAQLCPASGAHL